MDALATWCLQKVTTTVLLLSPGRILPALTVLDALMEITDFQYSTYEIPVDIFYKQSPDVSHN